MPPGVKQGQGEYAGGTAQPAFLNEFNLDFIGLSGWC
jgi:hypothetical protein